MDGKLEWIKKNCPRYISHFLFGPARKALAHREAFLIDDRDKNTIEFEENGGNSILIPRPWNARHTMLDKIVNGATYLETILIYFPDKLYIRS